jgi:hypothetical protein
MRMPRLVISCAAALAAAAVAIGVLATAGAATAGSAGGRPAGAIRPSGAAPGSAPAQPAPVLLINGARLQVMHLPDGGSAVTPLPGTAAGGLLSLRMDGATEEIPADALPYLGHGLDASLFNVSNLQQAEIGGRLPVRLSFTGRTPDLPGVTITSTNRGIADGYLTEAGAYKFGTALQKQFSTPDHGTGRGLFAGGTDIALVGAPAPVASPRYPMHTLTVTATNSAGKPDTGDTVVVFDGADLNAFGLDPNESFGTFFDGVARFSVPTGSYWVIGSFQNTRGTTFWADIHPEVAVAEHTMVHLAQSAATSKVTMVTPRPATQQEADFALTVSDPHGEKAGVTWSQQPGLNMRVSPMTDKPQAGMLQAYAAADLTSPSTAAGPPYAYNLFYRDEPGIVPPQRYQVGAASLAAVTEKYYQDVLPATGMWQETAIFADQGMAWRSYVTPASTRVQYFSTAADLAWAIDYAYFVGDSTNGVPTGGQYDNGGTYRVLSPGSRVVRWNEYPLHPQPTVSYGGFGATQGPQIPSAIRTGNTLSLDVNPFSDNQPGHAGESGDATSYQIAQDGAVISEGSAGNGIPAVTLSPKPSQVAFTYDAANRGSSYELSTSTQTTWTWPSSPDPSATVPSPWYCSQQPSGQYLRRCAVQPMMTLDYHVHNLGLNGTAPAGQQAIGLNVGHIQLASAAKITRTSAQVSCNGGTTWQKAAVRAMGNGNFTITFEEKSACCVTTKVTATDSVGGSVTETINNAYQVTGSAALDNGGKGAEVERPGSELTVSGFKAKTSLGLVEELERAGVNGRVECPPRGSADPRGAVHSASRMAGPQGQGFGLP